MAKAKIIIMNHHQSSHMTHTQRHFFHLNLSMCKLMSCQEVAASKLRLLNVTNYWHVLAANAALNRREVDTVVGRSYKRII